MKAEKEKTMKVTITLTKEQKERAKEISEIIFGKENISGLYSYWIKKWKKESDAKTEI